MSHNYESAVTMTEVEFSSLDTLQSSSSKLKKLKASATRGLVAIEEACSSKCMYVYIIE